MATHQDYLFSASDDKTIRKWNIAGYSLLLLTKQSTDDLLVFDGFLFTVSENKMRKWTLDGKPVQIYEEHKGTVRYFTVWNDTLFGGGSEKTVIQLTGECLIDLK